MDSNKINKTAENQLWGGGQCLASPKISIIIPVYNVGEYIEKALDSVVSQTLKEIEIICIDDDSKDNSLDIIKEYAKNDSRFVVIELKENKGQGYARNIGIEKAQGEYVMMLDPDDWFEPYACEAAYNQAKKYNNDIVFFNYFNYLEGSNKRFIDDRWYNSLKENEAGYQMNIHQNNIPYCFYHITRIHNRKFLIDNNCRYSETYCGEENIFNVSTAVFAKSISFLHIPLYTVRVFSRKNKYKQNVFQKRAERYQEIIDNLNLSYNFIKKHPCGSYKNTYLTFHISHEIGNCLFCSKIIKHDKEKVYAAFLEDLKRVLSETDISRIKEKIDTVKLERLLKCDRYWKYLLRYKYFNFLFSVENSYEKKIITILGIRFKFGKKNL